MSSSFDILTRILTLCVDGPSYHINHNATRHEAVGYIGKVPKVRCPPA